MPACTRTGPQIGSLTRKKHRQRFSFPGKIENTSQPDAGEPPQTTKTGEDLPPDHTSPTDPLAHTSQTTERDVTSPIGGVAARFWPAAQLKSGPAPAATASETAGCRLGRPRSRRRAPNSAARRPRAGRQATGRREVRSLSVVCVCVSGLVGKVCGRVVDLPSSWWSGAAPLRLVGACPRFSLRRKKTLSALLSCQAANLGSCSCAC